MVAAAAYSWRFLLVVAAVAVLVYGLVKLRLLVFPIIIALMLTTIVAPAAEWLTKRGVPRGLASLTLILGGLAAIVGLVVLLAPLVAGELGDVGTSLREGTDRVLRWLAEGPFEVSERDVDRFIDQAGEQISQSRGQIASGVVAGAIALIEVIAGILLTIVLLFFFVRDGDRINRWIESQFRDGNQQHAREMGVRAWAVLRGYVRGIVIIALFDGAVIGVTVLVIGAPLAAPLALITFFGAFFPIVGAVVAGVIAALVTLVTSGLSDALIVTAVTVVINQLEGDVLQPLVMGKSLNLHPVAILVALTAGGILAGVPGAFLAVPVAAVAATVGNYLKSVGGTEPISTTS
ncbi:MAG TPA: AI-2E family transporter [Actinomycetota bacterium]|nr:AI-2E family transporter [Actinomycetota bacterium]